MAGFPRSSHRCLAHELRNPLAPIRSAAHTLGLLGGADTRVGWIAGVLERQRRHITRLVDDLLDVSRIASGKITLHREVVRGFAAYLAKPVDPSALEALLDPLAARRTG